MRLRPCQARPGARAASGPKYLLPLLRPLVPDSARTPLQCFVVDPSNGGGESRTAAARRALRSDLPRPAGLAAEAALGLWGPSGRAPGPRFGSATLRAMASIQTDGQERPRGLEA